MSSQRGNTVRTRSQKHENKTAFKNTLHDTSHTTKCINNIQVSDVCIRCKDIIEWKIKYKKYKPLTQPRKCVKCDQKTVKQAYHVMCLECGSKLKVCTKCCQSKELVAVEKKSDHEELKLDKEMKALLQSLPERKRRTFLRYMKRSEEGAIADAKNKKDDLMNKLNALKDEDDLDVEEFSDDN